MTSKRNNFEPRQMITMALGNRIFRGNCRKLNETGQKRATAPVDNASGEQKVGKLPFSFFALYCAACRAAAGGSTCTTGSPPVIHNSFAFVEQKIGSVWPDSMERARRDRDMSSSARRSNTGTSGIEASFTTRGSEQSIESLTSSAARQRIYLYHDVLSSSPSSSRS